MMFTFKLISVLLVSLSICFAEDVELQVEIPQENQESQTTEASNLPSYLDKLNNVSNLVAENITLTNATEEVNTTLKHVSCIPGFGSPVVELVNDTELIKLLSPDANITSKDTPAKCIAVLFYSKFCLFSSLAAPAFNSLSRAYPDIKMVAINAMIYHLFNTQNGIVGLPSLLLFHNGKIVAKYNESSYKLELFLKFITKNTGINVEEKFSMIERDYEYPVTSNDESYISIVFSWCFIILCAAYYFTKTKWWQWIVETVQSNWRESEAQAQHEHVD